MIYNIGIGVVGVNDVVVDDASVVSSGVARIDLSTKQDSLTAGAGITIDPNNVISVNLPNAEGGEF